MIHVPVEGTWQPPGVGAPAVNLEGWRWPPTRSLRRRPDGLGWGGEPAQRSVPVSPSHPVPPFLPEGPCQVPSALTPSPPAGDTGSDVPLTGRSSPPAAEKPPLPARSQWQHAPSPAPPAEGPPTEGPPAEAPPTEAAPTAPPDREPGAGPERRGLPGAHARSAAARRVHSRRSFQRPRARRRPALLKLSSLPPSCHAPPHALEQEETPL